MLVPPLPGQTRADAKGSARISSHRRARETGGATLHGRGQEHLLVRPFDAIDRRLGIVALAQTLLGLALRDGKRAGFRDQAIRLLKQQVVLGRRLTGGKLAEAIGLDFDKHRRDWAHAWLR